MDGPQMTGIPMAAKRKGRKNHRQKSDAEITSPPIAIQYAQHPTPNARLCIGSTMDDCDRCGRKWGRGSDREAAIVNRTVVKDGVIVTYPEQIEVTRYHRVFLLRQYPRPQYSVYRHHKTGRKTLDIWPLLPVERALCHDCWEHMESVGFDQWCASIREWEKAEDPEFYDEEVEITADGFGLDVWCEAELLPQSPMRAALQELREMHCCKSNGLDSQLHSEDIDALKREISDGHGIIRDSRFWRGQCGNPIKEFTPSRRKF